MAARVRAFIARRARSVNVAAATSTEARLTGTIRTYSPEVREHVLSRVRQVAEGVTAACSACAEVEIQRGTPPVVNDAGIAGIVRAAAEAIVGPERVSSSRRTMGSEDAAFFLEEVLGCYFFLGAANPKAGIDAPHHNPRFDVDESVLPIGVAVFAQALAHYL